MDNMWFPTEKFKKYLRDPFYMLALIVAAIGTYGYWLTHETVGGDFLANDIYVFRGWNRVGRFTQSTLNALLNWNHQSRFLTGFLSVVLLCLSAILFCILSDRFLPDINKACQVLFSVLFISAPIYAEGMSYQFPNACGLGFACFASALTIYWVNVYLENKRFAYLAAGSFLLMVLTSWYEAFLQIYVCAAFSYLLLAASAHEEKRGFRAFIRTGMILLVPLLFGIGGEYCIQRILVRFLGKDGAGVGNNIIEARNVINLPTDLNLLRHLVQRFYLFAGVRYLPITLFVVVKTIGFILSVLLSVKKKTPLIFISWLGMHISNLILQVLTRFQTGYRSSISLGYYDAFIIMLAAYQILRIPFRSLFVRKTITFAAAVCFCWLVLLQISESSYWYYWDYRRYNEEREVIRQVGYRINSDFDCEKPVAFTGSYIYSDTIRDRVWFSVHSRNYPLAVRIAQIFGVTTIIDTEKDGVYFAKLPDTAVQEGIKWSLTAFGNDGMMHEYFGYEGFKFFDCSSEQLEEARMISGEMPKWPSQDSIRDMGDYIIVHF